VNTLIRNGAIIVDLYTMHHKKSTKIPTEGTYKVVVLLSPLNSATEGCSSNCGALLGTLAVPEFCHDS
jgi:hypothetical protein